MLQSFLQIFSKTVFKQIFSFATSLYDTVRLVYFHLWFDVWHILTKCRKCLFSHQQCWIFIYTFISCNLLKLQAKSTEKVVRCLKSFLKFDLLKRTVPLFTFFCMIKQWTRGCKICCGYLTFIISSYSWGSKLSTYLKYTIMI